MGLPLGPTFANIFMCFHEQNWLDNCPSSFKPIFYRRYIDDTFLLFTDQTHVTRFLEYLNSMHPSIKFTYETEVNGKLSFLDINVCRSNLGFQTSVFRKPTFTGLGSSFFSFSPLKFKIAPIMTLLTRAYRICSDKLSFQVELNFLSKFFANNGYPKYLIEKYIKNFLQKIANKKIN